MFEHYIHTDIMRFVRGPAQVVTGYERAGTLCKSERTLRREQEYLEWERSVRAARDRTHWIYTTGQQISENRNLGVSAGYGGRARLDFQRPRNKGRDVKTRWFSNKREWVGWAAGWDLRLFTRFDPWWSY